MIIFRLKTCFLLLCLGLVATVWHYYSFVSLLLEAQRAKFPWKPSERLTLLVMGLDQNAVSPGLFSSRWARADVLKVVVFDPQAGEMRVLSIPRDTMVEFPGMGRQKINAAHAFGGVRLQIQAVEHLLGIHIQRHLVLTQSALGHVLDKVGPLPLKVERGMNYDDQHGRLHIHFKKGMQSLSGTQLIAYARFRGGEDGDLGRIRRQNQVGQCLREHLKNPLVWPLLPRAFQTLRDEVNTDMSRSEMLALAGQAARERWPLRNRTLATRAREVDGVDYLVAQRVAQGNLRQWLLQSAPQCVVP